MNVVRGNYRDMSISINGEEEQTQADNIQNILKEGGWTAILWEISVEEGIRVFFV